MSAETALLILEFFGLVAGFFAAATAYANRGQICAWAMRHLELRRARNDVRVLRKARRLRSLRELT